MKYTNVIPATFISRPNRFIAVCEIDDEEVICHVKNTGRCKELLLPGSTVYLEKSHNPTRKTKYDLVAVLKGDKLFNIDSQAPNKVFYEWLMEGGLFDDITLIRPETTYKSSRFDFYVEHGDRKAFIEVKGVTLEKDGVLLFPDAPTERGVKHIFELCDSVCNGYEAIIAFIVQTDKAKYFTPNKETHLEFANALTMAKEAGVKIICLCCDVEIDSLKIKESVEVRL